MTKATKTSSTGDEQSFPVEEFSEENAGPRVEKVPRTDADTSTRPATLNPAARAIIALAAAITIAEPRRFSRAWSTLSNSSSAFAAATDEQATRLRMRRQLQRVLALATHETFYEGISSAFAERLRELIVDFGPPLVAELADVMSAEGLPPEIGFEALTTLAELKSGSIAVERQSLLEWALMSPVPEMRYGAALGAAAVRDPAVIPVLKKAIQREQIADLRRNLEKILVAISGE